MKTIEIITTALKGTNCTIEDYGDKIVVTPKKPIWVDPENGDEFYDGDETFSFVKATFKIEKCRISNYSIGDIEENEDYSKRYKTRRKCEIGLAEYIMKKNNVNKIELRKYE